MTPGSSWKLPVEIGPAGKHSSEFVESSAIDAGVHPGKGGRPRMGMIHVALPKLSLRNSSAVASVYGATAIGVGGCEWGKSMSFWRGQGCKSGSRGVSSSGWLGS